MKTPVSRISLVLEAINDGMGLNAACRTFHVGKNTIKRWINRLGDLKESLLLYALCHHFIQLQIEGDELYTKVSENKPAHLSEGWTVVLMDRASRFIWEMQCGERNTDLFVSGIPGGYAVETDGSGNQHFIQQNTATTNPAFDDSRKKMNFWMLW